MSYATPFEREFIRLQSTERQQDAQAERLADLELSPLGDALGALLRIAEDVMESRTATQDEKRLAERLLDACGPREDCFLIRECAQ